MKKKMPGGQFISLPLPRVAEVCVVDFPFHANGQFVARFAIHRHPVTGLRSVAAFSRKSIASPLCIIFSIDTPPLSAAGPLALPTIHSPDTYAMARTVSLSVDIEARRKRNDERPLLPRAPSSRLDERIETISISEILEIGKTVDRAIASAVVSSMD